MNKTFKRAIVIGVSLALPVMTFAQITPTTTIPGPGISFKSIMRKKALAKKPIANMLVAKVTSVSDNTVMVNNVKGDSYTVDASKAKVLNSKGALVSISDIKADDAVQVRGKIDGNTVVATLIRIMPVAKKMMHKKVMNPGGHMKTKTHKKMMQKKDQGSSGNTTSM